MPTEFQALADVIEESYEFTLSYAAQGHASDAGTPQGRQLRQLLARSAEAMRGLAAAGGAAVESEALAPAAPYEQFFRILARDAEDAATVVELVLAQPAIGSQLIDNMNASIHLRALLTDIFLVAEILESHQSRSTASQHEVL